MLPLLIDEGLPPRIAEALRAVEVDALAIGDVGAPAKGSPDETNVPWCAKEGRLLVTNDRGRKDRVILDLLKFISTTCTRCSSTTTYEQHRRINS